MIPYIYAKEHKKKRVVYGSFYNVCYNNKIIECRNLLEIYDKTYFASKHFTNHIKNLSVHSTVTPLTVPQHQGVPDAIFIMMNPGSSRPLEPNYTIPCFQIHNLLPQNIKSNPLILTKPDNAQYQIMNVMDYMEWKHIRILNLSDYRDGSSQVFLKAYTKLSAIPHSLFSTLRTAELKATLTNEKLPIFAAWGQYDELIPLASQCLSRLPPTHQPNGVQSGKYNPCLYAYASPSFMSLKLAWLRNMKPIVDKLIYL